MFFFRFRIVGSRAIRIPAANRIRARGRSNRVAKLPSEAIIAVRKFFSMVLLSTKPSTMGGMG